MTSTTKLQKVLENPSEELKHAKVIAYAVMPA